MSLMDPPVCIQLVSFQGHMMAVKRMAWGPGDQVNYRPVGVISDRYKHSMRTPVNYNERVGGPDR